MSSRKEGGQTEKGGGGYRRPPPKEVRQVTDEERYLAMIGTPGIIDPAANLEQYCGCCGQEHKRPDLLDNYYLCHACQNALREPVSLRDAWKNVFKTQKLEICYATYGHPTEPVAFEVTDIVQARVNELWQRDRLKFRKTEMLNEVFGHDPCPGEYKQLKVRYRMLGLHAMCQLDVMPNGQLASNFILIAPDHRYLVINKATYGHPKGKSSQGRMSTDCQEIVQGIIDSGLSGGSYLTISHMNPVKRIFGDPCPGYPKDLRLKFEVCGREGCVTEDELRGFLKKRIHIEFAPTIKPLIFVESATFGISATGRRIRIDELNKELRQIHRIEHRQANGSMPNAEEIRLLKEKEEIIEDLEGLRNAEVNFIDIREKVQRMADRGGAELIMHKDRFDCCAVFGNPSPGIPKLLEVSVESPGHDAERRTDSLEMTTSGHPRNFITNKSAKIVVPVRDIKGAKLGGKALTSKMLKTLQFRTDMSSPVIYITKATYGILEDSSRVSDVTPEVQAMVKERSLHLGTDLDLYQTFKTDPAPGMRKKLRIQYVTRGFIGAVRVREKNDFFSTTIELGYPSAAGEDC